MSNKITSRKTFKNIKHISSPLRDTYGEMIVKAGTILYHTSSTPFKTNITKPMLFLTFHPSEFVKNCEGYLTQVVIKRDLSLLFMVDEIIGDMKIISALGKLIGAEDEYLAKEYDNNLSCYKKYLQKEKLDGWFTSIENHSATEIAINNNSALFTAENSETLEQNWFTTHYNNCTNNCENCSKYVWGNLYSIHTGEKSVSLNLPIKYKEMIKEYIKKGKMGTLQLF